MAKLFLIIASISGFLAVAIGAFGAHGLKQKISVDLMAAYQTGVQYHFYHTLALPNLTLPNCPYALPLLPCTCLALARAVWSIVEQCRAVWSIVE